MARYAITKDRERILPEKHIETTCDGCGAQMIAKMGEINVHHWAHKSAEDCAPDREPKTKWHYEWQDQFPKEFQEIILKDSIGNRFRADVHVLGLTIEFQHSSISQGDIDRREICYSDHGQLIWIVDDCVTNLDRFTAPVFIDRNDGYIYRHKTNYKIKKERVGNIGVLMKYGFDGIEYYTKKTREASFERDKLQRTIQSNVLRIDELTQTEISLRTMNKNGDTTIYQLRDELLRRQQNGPEVRYIGKDVVDAMKKERDEALFKNAEYENHNRTLLNELREAKKEAPPNIMVLQARNNLLEHQAQETTAGAKRTIAENMQLRKTLRKITGEPDYPLEPLSLEYAQML